MIDQTNFDNVYYTFVPNPQQFLSEMRMRFEDKFYSPFLFLK